MRYLTKEWYDKMQHTDMYSYLKIDERAEEFSEDFYDDLYKKRKNEYIELNQDIIDYEKFKKSYQEFFEIQAKLIENLKGTYFNDLQLSSSDIKFDSEKIVGEEITEEKLKSEFQRINEETFGGMTIDESFDFRKNCLIERVKTSIPEDILNKVKDIRVLAFDYVSSEVYELIKEYCIANEKFVEEKSSEYSKVRAEQFKDESISFLQESFHDCDILDVISDNNDLIIKLDNTDGFTSKTKITFKNCNVILDENIKECCWKYSEIYKNKDKYELHILTLSNIINFKFSFKESLRELIVECEDIIVE